MVSPLSGHRVPALIVVLIVAAHAAFVAFAWKPAPEPARPRARSMSMRLVSASQSRPAVETVARTPAVRTMPPKARPATKKTIAPAAPAVVAQAEAPAIQGIAFAPARIAFGPPATPRDSRPAPPPAPPIHLLQMQAQMMAARAQLAETLQRELGSWQAPEATAQGACTLAAVPDARLACDSEPLAAALAPRESLLIGLLHAWRGMEPGTQGLSIAVVGGRYEARWL
ncbi:hypothetical protein DZC73_00645 [Albitalea terrae]|uniref:Uncharacterized protein n=1 Tax=Piscinibacter terrae TaxID=2496871 RepID=A0A3N7HX32_9BURK|nr:hypothetical protein DZC73_00645 [Albitalea terrae]